MALHRLTSITLGVPDVGAAAVYYEELGLSPRGENRFATVDGGGDNTPSPSPPIPTPINGPADLSIAPQTVKFHLTNVYRKLGVANRTEAIRFAFQHELVEPELVSV